MSATTYDLGPVDALDPDGRPDMTGDGELTAEQRRTLEHLFTEAHTAYTWDDTPVSDELVRTAVHAAVHGPTAFNIQPLRVLVVRGAGARQRLAAHLSSTNAPKTRTAPLTLVLAADAGFARTAETVFPAKPDLIHRLYDDPAAARPAAQLNAALQAAYLLIALRATGLVVGPMTGADFPGIDGEFFADTPVHSFLVVNLGRPASDSHRPRNPRVDPDVVVRTV